MNGRLVPPTVRRVLFAAIFLCSTGLLVRGDDQTGTPPSPPAAIGTEVTANLVNLLFLFDRVVSPPPTATTKNYLARVSDPSSPLYPNYLAYQQGKMGRSELKNRLPHVAMLGDSLTQNFHFSSLAGSFWRARTQWRENWFLDTDPDPDGIFSVYERLQHRTPLVATEYNRPGALVSAPGTQEDLRKRLVRTHNFSGQVNGVLRAKRFPDLIIIWIGHNNLDWVHGLSSEERERPESHLDTLAAQFRLNYRESLQSLIDGAKMQKHKVAILVFGVANIDTYLKARRQEERLHTQNPKLYPHLNSGPRSFESLKPPYRKNMARLAVMMNTELRTMVANLKRQLNDSDHVQLEYSEALTKVDFSRLELINSVDGWHPSVKGHKVLADTAFNALNPSLVFLGIGTKPTRKTRLLASNYQKR